MTASHNYKNKLGHQKYHRAMAALSLERETVRIVLTELTALKTQQIEMSANANNFLAPSREKFAIMKESKKAIKKINEHIAIYKLNLSNVAEKERELGEQYKYIQTLLQVSKVFFETGKALEEEKSHKSSPLFQIAEEALHNAYAIIKKLYFFMDPSEEERYLAKRILYKKTWDAFCGDEHDQQDDLAEGPECSNDYLAGEIMSAADNLHYIDLALSYHKNISYHIIGQRASCLAYSAASEVKAVERDDEESNYYAEILKKYSSRVASSWAVTGNCVQRNNHPPDLLKVAKNFSQSILASRTIGRVSSAPAGFFANSINKSALDVNDLAVAHSASVASSSSSQ